MTNPAGAAVLWTGDHEEGSLNDWYAPGTQASPGCCYGGGEYNSGIADTTTSTPSARTGAHGALLTITTPNSETSGTRLFRWQESRTQRELYFSAWFLFPTTYTLTANPATGQFWNLFQFKSRSTSGDNDPLWYIDVQNGPAGDMRTDLIWWHRTLPGPHAGESGFRRYSSGVTIPVGRWVHFEAFLRQSKDFDGEIKIWQDGSLIFHQTNIRTSFDNPAYNSWRASNEWAVNLYSDGLIPNPAVIHLDDAVIATTYQGPGAPPDTTPPIISAVSVSNISSSSATITWTTNEASDTQIEFGTSTAYGSSTTLSSALVTSHSQALTGLAADTLYNYRVKSRDAAGNLGASANFTFTTGTSPSSPPEAPRNLRFK